MVPDLGGKNETPPITVETAAMPPPEAIPPVAVQAAVEDVDDHTLLDLGRDFVFFTTALLHTHGKFSRDPLVLFNQAHWEEEDELRPFSIDCDYPVFSRLGTTLLDGKVVDWDRRLCGIIVARWELCRNFVSSIVLFGRAPEFYAKVGWHELSVVDPTTFHSGRVLSVLPILQIVVFALSGTGGLVYMHPAATPPHTLPFPAVATPSRQTMNEARAVLATTSDPTQASEKLSNFLRNDEVPECD